MNMKWNKYACLVAWAIICSCQLSESLVNIADVPCGRKPTELPAQGRILGGEVARIEDYPYLVSLRRYGEHYCGGSIVR